ncbi:MAG: YdcF family protein [Treponema sp.]|nr:YdcF family protein [Treponema sp.]
MRFIKSLPGFRRVLLKISLSALVLFAAMVLSTLLINIGIVKGSEKYIYRSAADAPPKTTVLVLGSQIRAGSLSPVLRDRVSGGIELMERGKGRKMLLSGDHGQRYYDEVNTMRLFVLANAPAIAEEDIFMDHAGFSTWDSMYRARDVFQVKDLLIVTQEFHINRAVFIARSLGLEAGGLALNQDRFKGRSLRYWKFREYFARVKAFFFTIVKPKPKYLGDPIPILGDGRQTWI